MEDILEHLITKPLSVAYIKEHLAGDISTLLLNRSRNEYETLLKKLVRCNTEFVNSLAPQHGAMESYQGIDPLQVFLELICFISSVGKSLSELRGKKVLLVGSNYGIEVIILRTFGVDAQGIDNNEKMFKISNDFYTYCASRLSLDRSPQVFILEDFVQFVNEKKDLYDMVIARNLNPLAPVEYLLQHIGGILNTEGKAIIQWDALYQEDLAHRLYAPKKHIYYNDSLRTLLDGLARYTFHTKKTRAMFLYLIK
jgi:hypothetical protein